MNSDYMVIVSPSTGSHKMVTHYFIDKLDAVSKAKQAAKKNWVGIYQYGKILWANTEGFVEPKRLTAEMLP